MVDIHPMQICGRWRDGYVLDRHVVSSTFIGHNEFGHPMFDTKRTDIGQLLYRLKNRSDPSGVDQIIDTAVDFVRSWNPRIDAIVPVPPSQRRKRQPVFVLASGLGERLSVPVIQNCVTRVKKLPQLKNINDFAERKRLLEEAHSVDPALVSKKNVLLFDDLYQSGATMNAVASALYDSGDASDVFALAITRTQN